MKTLKVTAVEAKKDKNQKDYNLITLSTPDSVMQGGVRIKIEPKTQRIVRYPESYLEDKSPQYGHDFKVGDTVAGDIVTVGNLFPYNIVDPSGNVTRQVSHASHVVLGDSDNEDAFNAAIKREFESRGKFLAREENIEAYTKFWGVSPETGEMIEDAIEEAETATL